MEGGRLKNGAREQVSCSLQALHTSVVSMRTTSIKTAGVEGGWEGGRGGGRGGVLYLSCVNENDKY